MPPTTCAVKFQERFPLRMLGADFIYINKNQKKWGCGCARVWLLLRVCMSLVEAEQLGGAWSQRGPAKPVLRPGLREEAEPS